MFWVLGFEFLRFSLFLSLMPSRVTLIFSPRSLIYQRRSFTSLLSLTPTTPKRHKNTYPLAFNSHFLVLSLWSPKHFLPIEQIVIHPNSSFGCSETLLFHNLIFTPPTNYSSTESSFPSTSSLPLTNPILQTKP